MWHTSQGDRILQGSEAILVANAIDTMVDSLMLSVDIDADDDFEFCDSECESGIAVYDSLRAAQRVGLLHQVAQHLLADTPETIPLSAALEATIAAIFVEIRDQVAIEISLYGHGFSDQLDVSWRQRVLEACEFVQSEDEESVVLPQSSCCDFDRWETLIEQLADAILWDRDFEMADTFMDADPSESLQRRQLLGIHEDYFTSVAPDPRPADVPHLVSETRSIIRAKPR